MTALILLKDFLETQIEIWRPIADFDGYEVSSLGRVRSWRRPKGVKGFRGTISGRRETSFVLTPPKESNKQSRLKISLCRDGKVYNARVHLLVAQAFLPNPDNLPQVNHKTGNFRDNRVANLEWISKEGNIAHAVKHGLTAHGEKNRFAKLNPQKVRESRQLYASGVSQEEIGRIMGVSQVAIGLALRGVTWRRVDG